MLTTIFIIFYILLYISHIILGPYYYTFLYKGEPIKYMSKNIVDVLKYSVYITYVSMLYTIYFLKNPNTETYMNGLLLTIISLVMYVILYHNSEHIIESIILHTILILPYIFFKYYYNIRITTFKPTFISYFTIMFLIIYMFIYKYLYE